MDILYTVSMKKRIVRLLFLAALVAGAWWYFQREYSSVPSLEQAVRTAGEAMQQAAQGVSAPPPLRGPQTETTGTLTQAGVLKRTNIQRRDNGGLPPLSLNDKLSDAAAAKMNDLFAKQYFEHVSPTGIGPSELAARAGYDYVVIGENLALGNFKDDQALIQAWMDSPGHRANILGASYSEIGIAVGQGIYEGNRTWIAVQEFGKPRSACPEIDDALRAKIDADEATIRLWGSQAQRRKSELDAMDKPRTRDERDAYNAKVDAYNALIRQINALSQQIQGEITVYNGQVQAYNACANA